MLSDGKTFVYEDAAEAQRDCLEWQILLKLADWEIVVKISPMEEIEDGCARVIYRRAKKQAIIKLLRAEDCSQNDDYPLDQQKSLVHELLHLHLSFSDPLTEKCDHAAIAMEVAVDSIARGFVRQRRALAK